MTSMSNLFKWISARLAVGVVAGLVCVAIAGCGAGGSLVTGSASKAVPGVPAGPILGYLWSTTDQTLRPILGVIGSSLIGQTMVPAGAYVAGAASSASEFGVVEDVAGTLYSVSLPSPTPTRLAGGAPDHAQIVLSPSGGEAVVYASGGSNLIFIHNLATQAQVTTMPMPDGMKLGSAIVSDAGTVLASTQASPVVLGTLSPSGQFARVTTMTQLGGMTFLPGIEDALAADRAKNTLSLLHGLTGLPTVQALVAIGVNQPVAVSVSQDAHYGVVANGGDKNVLWIDLKNGGDPAKLTCACQPAVLNMLAGGKAFRINDLGAGPVWMVDLSSPAPKLIFVPATHAGV